MNFSSTKIVKRKIFDEVITAVGRREAVVLIGPRQSGKTTTLMVVKQWVEQQGLGNTVYFSFEDILSANAFEAAPVEFIRGVIDPNSERNFVFLDEVQHLKDGARSLKAVFDLMANVQMFLTGSTSLKMREIEAALAGRAIEFRIFPFDFREFLKVRAPHLSAIAENCNAAFLNHLLGGENGTIDVPNSAELEPSFATFLNEFMVFGGYPSVVLESQIVFKTKLLSSIVNGVFEKDILRLARGGDLERFLNTGRWLAAAVSNLLEIKSLSADIGLPYRTAKSYLEMLELAFVVELVRPFFTNPLTELKKAPKIFFVDAGFRNALLSNFVVSEFRSDSGQLAELFVFTELKKMLPVSWKIRYWRSKHGQEVDFVVSDGGQLTPIEVKFRKIDSPTVPKALASFLKRYKPQRAFVVNRTLCAKTRYGETEVLFVPLWCV